MIWLLCEWNPNWKLRYLNYFWCSFLFVLDSQDEQVNLCHLLLNIMVVVWIKRASGISIHRPIYMYNKTHSHNIKGHWYFVFLLKWRRPQAFYGDLWYLCYLLYFEAHMLLLLLLLCLLVLLFLFLIVAPVTKSQSHRVKRCRKTCAHSRSNIERKERERLK